MMSRWCRWSRWCLGGVSAVSMLIQGVHGVLVVSWWLRVGGVGAVVLVVRWFCHAPCSLQRLQCCCHDDDGDDDDDDDDADDDDDNDDDDDEGHDDDNNEDDDDVTTTLRLQVWVEVGGGTDVDVCYEITYGLIMMLLSKQLRTFPQSMQQPGQWAAHLIRGVDMPVACYTCTETLTQIYQRKKMEKGWKRY